MHVHLIFQVTLYVHFVKVDVIAHVYADIVSTMFVESGQWKRVVIVRHPRDSWNFTQWDKNSCEKNELNNFRE
jgi:hypothetical protein